jgi:hypothetical protein
MWGGRWPTRARAAPQRLSFAAEGLSHTTRSLCKARDRPDWQLFDKPISQEIFDMTSKQVYDTVTRSEVPPGQRNFQGRILLNIKRDPDGRIVEYKARFVKRGDQQAEYFSFEDLFAPTAASASLRALYAVAAKKGQQIQQIDLSTAYQHPDLLSDVDIKLRSGLVGDFWQLKKA